jgi:hypothetical protein
MFFIKLCRTNLTHQLLDNCILQAPIFIVQARGLTKLSRNLLKQENKPAQPNQIPTNRKHGRSQPAPILIQQRSRGWTYLDDSQITTGEKLQQPGAFPLSSESLPLAPAQEKKQKQNRSSQHLLPGLGGHVNRRRPSLSPVLLSARKKGIGGRLCFLSWSGNQLAQSKQVSIGFGFGCLVERNGMEWSAPDYGSWAGSPPHATFGECASIFSSWRKRGEWR